MEARITVPFHVAPRVNVLGYSLIIPGRVCFAPIIHELKIAPTAKTKIEFAEYNLSLPRIYLPWMYVRTVRAPTHHLKISYIIECVIKIFVKNVSHESCKVVQFSSKWLYRISNVMSLRYVKYYMLLSSKFYK